MISLFLNGHLDVTAQSCFTMFPIETEHPGLFKFVYGQYTNSYYFMVPVNSPIQRLQGISGNTIGTWKSPTAENYIRLIMRQAGVAQDDYKVQRFGATEWAPALENHQVPVVFGFDVPLATLSVTGKYVYLDKSAVARLLPKHKVFNGGGFLSTRLISEDPLKAKAIREALYEAIEIIRTKPQRTAEIVMATLGASKDAAQQSKFDEFTWPTPELLLSAEKTLGLLQDSDIVKGDIKVKKMFWWPQ